MQQAGEAAQRRNAEEAAEAARRAQTDAAAIRDHARAATEEVARNLAAVGAVRRDVIAGPGRVADVSLDAAGRTVESVSGRAPTLGAAAGGVVAGTVTAGAQYHPQNPAMAFNLARTVALARTAGPAVAEAVQRHGIEESAHPSLSHRIGQEQASARALLRTLEVQGISSPRGQEVSGRDDADPRTRTRLLPRTDTEDYLDRFVDAMQRGDQAAFARTAHEYAGTPAVQAWRQTGREDLQAWKQAEQDRALEQQQQWQMQQEQQQQQENQSRSRGRSM